MVNMAKIGEILHRLASYLGYFPFFQKIITSSIYFIISAQWFIQTRTKYREGTDDSKIGLFISLGTGSRDQRHVKHKKWGNISAL